MSPPDPDRILRSHRAWLARLGILDRPWLILGSAPAPTLPAELLAKCARIDINNAGKTATALGLGRADLTVRTYKKSWAEYPDLDTNGLLWVHTKPTFIVRWLLHRQRNAKFEQLRRWRRREREMVVDLVTGAALRGVGSKGKATTGVAVACYGLFVGVPEIILAGISLDTRGHSYDALQRARLQVEEDAFVFERIRMRPELSTTEAALSEATGIRLWQAGLPAGDAAQASAA